MSLSRESSEPFPKYYRVFKLIIVSFVIIKNLSNILFFVRVSVILSGLGIYDD